MASDKIDADGKHRVTVTLNDEDYERLCYWAKRRDNMSINNYLHYALDLAIKRENKDYDLPSLEAARLNQLVDTITMLSFNVHNLESMVHSGFDSLLRMTRGENYLMDFTDDAEVGSDAEAVENVASGNQGGF